MNGAIEFPGSAFSFPGKLWASSNVWKTGIGGSRIFLVKLDLVVIDVPGDSDLSSTGFDLPCRNAVKRSTVDYNSLMKFRCLKSYSGLILSFTSFSFVDEHIPRDRAPTLKLLRYLISCFPALSMYRQCHGTIILIQFPCMLNWAIDYTSLTSACFYNFPKPNLSIIREIQRGSDVHSDLFYSLIGFIPG